MVVRGKNVVESFLDSKIQWLDPLSSYKGLEKWWETAVAMMKLIPKIEIEDEAVVGSNVVVWNTAAHPMGTTRMGANPKTSVVDANGLAHDHSILFIVGSSVFATGSTANPTLTLAALSLCTAAAIDRQMP